MDTDLAEKTVSSSTVLSGGDEVRACVRALAVRAYVHSFHTRVHAYKSVAQDFCTPAVWVPTMRQNGFSLPVYMRTYVCTWLPVVLIDGLLYPVLYKYQLCAMYSIVYTVAAGFL